MCTVLCLPLRWLVSSRSVVPGDIGGQMGLFIGASILTILELFDYLYEVRIESLYWKKLKDPKYFHDFVCSLNDQHFLFFMFGFLHVTHSLLKTLANTNTSERQVLDRTEYIIHVTLFWTGPPAEALD